MPASPGVEGVGHAALVGNLGGLTSTLLGLDGGAFAGKLRLDVLYPVRGYKRCYDAGNGYGLFHAFLLPVVSIVCE